MTPVPGLVSVTFRHLGVAEIVPLVAGAGLRAIEWGGDVHVPTPVAARDAAARCAAAGVEIAAYGSYYRCAGDGFADVLATAVALGAARIRVWAGRHGSAAEPDRAAVVADLARVAAMAAGEGVEICVEYHANTLTDTLESTVDLLAAVPAVRPYWQPPIGDRPAGALAAVRALRPVTAHVFTWDDAGRRLPLAAGETLWRPVLAALPATRYALLEFVRDDDPAAFAEDAATLLAWLRETGARGT
ncbi:MAG: TIM barrel protein [Actinophytocola sp.]|uniref:sugar phosphate isomerase/epimerase family protein n=1 Tax=Actinophytocola sp. TaxID=1872138 RepID=UPI001326EB49|nr:TIM barrel protein [Actinophytocola sp.]MPZ80220.1 TIM barrel protein [Actinophytocola sp.]